MNKFFMAAAVLAGGALIPMQALAHVEYVELTSITPTIAGLSKTYSSGDTVSGNYGWADAADIDWGDSHHASWMSFYVTARSSIDIDVAADPRNLFLLVGSTQVPTQIGDLTPAFSVYSGILPPDAHDGATPLPSGKEGAWSSVGDTTMYNDSNEFATIQYLGHAGTVDGLATAVSWSGVLDPGVYSIAIGGTCYLRSDCGAFDEFNADTVNRGFFINLTTTPVPLPGAAWLMFSGLLGFMGLQKKRAKV